MADRTRISLKTFMADEGFESIADILESDFAMDSVAPALCNHGCIVEHDGHCVHGNPSVMLVLGVI